MAILANRKEGAGQVLLLVAAYAPGLGIRTFFSYLKMKRAANHASRQFYRSLVDSGVPSKEAHELADEYTSAVSVRQWMRSMSRAGGLQRARELQRSRKLER